MSLTPSDTHTLAGFKDYGAYWRYNYETIDEDPLYRYTGDELMADVRTVYKQVRLINVPISGWYVSK